MSRRQASGYRCLPSSRPTTTNWVRNSLPYAAHSGGDYVRWLGEEKNPRDLMRLFPAEPMRMWPIFPRVNKPENDDQSMWSRLSCWLRDVPHRLHCARLSMGDRGPRVQYWQGLPHGI